MAITRANPHLEEIIEVLDIHRAKYSSDDEARAYLSSEDNAWIDDEVFHCMTETRYFISNYYAYRDEKEGFKGLYPLFDSQEILHDEYRKLQKLYGKVRALVLKARQMGSTTYNMAEFFHETMFFEGVIGLVAAQDDETKSYFMGMYESALDFIPWWMRPRIKQRNVGDFINFDEKDDQLRLTRPGLKTWIYSGHAKKPAGIGRSKTFGKAMLSELAFWENGSQLSKALLPTFNTPDGFYIMESTANGRNDFWHNLWRRAEAGKVDWHPIYIPFYRRAVTYSIPILSTEVFILSKDEKEMKERIFKKDSFLVSNETFKWMRNRKEEFIATDGDDMMFSQEYTSEAEESFQTSAITAFPRGIINKYSKRTANPKWIGEIRFDFDKGRPHLTMREVDVAEDVPYAEEDDRLSIWEKPVRGQKYVVGVDVSLGNEGGDYSCCQVLQVSHTHEPDRQVACWHGYINPEDLAEIVFALCRYYEDALAAVEVNSMGMTTNTILMREYDYDNIYRFKRMDRLKNFITDIVGWWTDYKSKRALMSRMDKMLRCNGIEIPDKFTIDEFRDFTEEGAQGEGAHDDYIMALMIAEYCAHEGEFQEKRNSAPKTVSADANTFQILDRNGVLMLETHSQAEAELKSKKIIGSQIKRTSGSKADLMVKGKKYKIPSDFQNTDHSPIWDKDGTARKMAEDGFAAEDITPDAIAEFEAAEEELEASPDAWLYQ